ncbi:MAG: GIY-YIG nuclease family protein [Candidatus Acidiferrales bacterium]
MTLSKGAAASASKGWFCYLLKCADGTYYAGVAPNLEERLRKHNTGRGAKYTRGRRPVRLVWSRPCHSYAAARALEAQLKGWSRKKKRQLIAGSLRLVPLRETRSPRLRSGSSTG